MKTAQIDLIWLGDESPPPEWPPGVIWPVKDTSRAVAALMAHMRETCQADALLFWHSRLGPPDRTLVRALLETPGDVWHGGLRLGTGGLPGLLDFVTPTWMLNRDPDPAIVATSWRLSLDACLLRADVIRQLGGIVGTFDTLAGSALELGHRWITHGVIMRHVPDLVPAQVPAEPPALPLDDELRFVHYRAARWQWGWSAFRAALSGYAGLPAVLRAWNRVINPARRPPAPAHYRHHDDHATADLYRARVSVLVPTVDRYPYLRVLLGQLRQQTIRPHEIIIVDQTAPDRRDPALLDDFPDLPLILITLDEAGQCSSRNTGLQRASGDYVLFVDDDDEVEPDLIERHLRTLATYRAPVSCGTADEVGAGPLPEGFRNLRVSDVFPTNNTLVQRDVLRGPGLFDLAYERGQRADGDLGMRVYLSGALMIYNPAISVLHHHAPSGGLRKHKARVVTYASSRQKLTHRQLPSVTEIYLWGRYFTPRQARENLWQAVLGTYSIRGGIGRKLLKALVSTVMLPQTIRTIRGRIRQAEAMRRQYPQIPTLTDQTRPAARPADRVEMAD